MEINFAHCLVVLFLLFIILKALYNRKQDKKALDSTHKWCDASFKLNQYIVKNYTKLIKNPKNYKFKKLKQKEKETWENFLKYHPKVNC